MRQGLAILCLGLLACSSQSSRSNSSGGGAGVGGTSGSGGSGGGSGDASVGGSGGTGTGGGSTCTPCKPKLDPVPSETIPADVVIWPDAQRLAIPGGTSKATGRIELCAPENFNCGTAFQHADPMSVAKTQGNDLFVASERRVARIAPKDTQVTQWLPTNNLASPVIAFAVDAKDAFITVGNSIMRVDRAEPSDSYLVTSLNLVRQLGVGGNRLYYTSESGFFGFDIPATFGDKATPEKLKDISSGALLVVSSAEAYFATDGGGSNIFASDGTLGGTNELSQTDFPRIVDMVSGGPHLYAGTESGRVVRLKKEPNAQPDSLAELVARVIALTWHQDSLFVLIDTAPPQVATIPAASTCCL